VLISSAFKISRSLYTGGIGTAGSGLYITLWTAILVSGLILALFLWHHIAGDIPFTLNLALLLSDWMSAPKLLMTKQRGMRL
jgi:hypothetical protein